ncbi:MAG: DEAD/DEAH box helicase [Chloroflexota bacterium]|nr:DEAD/DEAH box helicase [Chloroflexota bacterium]
MGTDDSAGAATPQTGMPAGGSQGASDGSDEVAPDVRLRLRGNDLLIQFADSDSADAGRDRELRAHIGRAMGEPALVYDRRLAGYRTLAGAYRAVREGLEGDRYRVEADFDPAPALPFPTLLAQGARPYQAAALASWTAAGGRGVVVLPTGSGKTLVALMAIAQQGVWALVVVPTLDLLGQWQRAVIELLGAPSECVGVFGGGRRDLFPITIITYDSAAIHTRELNRFGLLVFDEVHHLPASSYRLAAEGTMAPFRLGLSATPERTDGLERDLTSLVGPVVYSRSPRDLAKHLAAFREEKITIALSAAEQGAYESAMATYRAYLRRRRLRITSPEEYQRWVIWPSANDPEARRAMLAHREARRLSFNAGAKTAVLVDLLNRHRGERVLIFTEFNTVVEGLSRDLLIPSITYKTPPAERTAVLEGFRSGRFTTLVTGRVLNEGVDVPDASVAIVLSGTGTRREYVQRLGRVLRPKAGPAVLYELVTQETAEVHLTRRRHARRPSEA